MKPERHDLARLFERDVRKAMEDAQIRLHEEHGTAADLVIWFSAWSLILEGSPTTPESIADVAQGLGPIRSHIAAFPKAVLGVSLANSSLMELAVRIFGSVEHVLDWMFADNTALGGNSPAAVLSEPGGAERVTALLVRIEHGVFS